MPRSPTLPPLLVKRQRGWELGLASYIDARGRTPPIIIAVGGGKGGVGKSLVSANLAVRIAASGLRVMAVDMDLGGANLHTYFGVAPPKFGLVDLCTDRHKTLADVTVASSVTGVQLVGGGRDELWDLRSPLGAQTATAGATPKMAESQVALAPLFDAIVAARERGELDVVILDLGAGTHSYTVDCFAAAHLGLVTVLPEPTSIENAYLFLKTLLFRLIDHVGENTGAAAAAAAVRAALLAPDAPAATAGGAPQTDRGRALGYMDKLRQLAPFYPSFVNSVVLALAGRIVGITINQVRGQKDIDVGKSMELICERYFGLQARACGHLNYDDAAWKSLRNRRLLVLDFPHSGLSRCFTELARSVLTQIGV